MKKTLSLFGVILLLLATLPACKKDDSDQIKANVTGKWKLSKVEPAALLTIAADDYYDFKAGEDDIVEVRRGGQLHSGTYNLSAAGDMKISMDGKLYDCRIDALDDHKFEFTSTEGNTTEKVYLSK